MEKEFVPYHFAVKMKDLGFNEMCFKIYSDYDCKLYVSDRINHHAITKAPLWQQAFQFFRDKHNAVVSFNWHTKGCLIDGEFVFKEEKTTRKELINWAYEIDYYGSNFERELTDESDAGGFGFETYEKARLACLEKLIELVSLQKPCS